MNEQEALAKMISPGKRRPGRVGGVLQIHVTRTCDKSCFGCTQGSNLCGNGEMISPEQFEQACQSLKGYFGTIGVFGGNPPVHPQFDRLCEILRKHFSKGRCGLWASRLIGKGSACRKTFDPGRSNINVHLSKEAHIEFKKGWPESRPFGQNQDSRHSPPFVAMQDVIEDESKRWELIANCDINKYWSAMICVFRGELRGFFCEIAGAQAILHQHEEDYPDLGLLIEPGWWKRPMSDFTEQVRFHCYACGVPLRGYGELSQSKNGTEQVSKTHEAIFKPKVKDRPVEVVTKLEDICPQSLKRMTDYLGNAKR